MTCLVRRPMPEDLCETGCPSSSYSWLSNSSCSWQYFYAGPLTQLAHNQDIQYGPRGASVKNITIWQIGAFDVRIWQQRAS